MIHTNPGHSVDAAERGDRLESWKEIAAYLRRGVTTVQRWEQQEGLPVHRLPHAKKGSVFAIKSELDDWWRARAGLGLLNQDAPAAAPPRDNLVPSGRRRLVRVDRRTGVALAALFALALAGLVMTRVLGQTSVMGLVSRWTGMGPRDGLMPEDAVLMLVVGDEAHAHRLYRVPIHAATWEAQRPLVVDARHAPNARLTGASPAERSNMASPRPDGTGWVVNRYAPDSGDIDLFDVPLAGSVRRLTHAPGFDRDPSHAPDGSRLAFATQRFDSLGRFDLAVLNLLSAAVRPLVRGVASDEWPMWSADGSRIAFLRRLSASDRQDLCIVTQDGAVTRCWSGSESLDRSPELLGWYDARRVVLGLRVDTASHMALALLDVTSDAVTTIASGLRLPRLAPNGRWVVCQCAVPGYPDGTWFVVPLDRPRDFRPVRIDGLSGQAAALIWAPDSPRPPYLHALAIVAGPGEPIAGVPHQLHALGRDAAGAPIELGAVTWRSSDNTVAAIDSSGLLLPRRSGAVRISASSGGWRAVTAIVGVRAPATRVVVDERWQVGFTPAWRVFGTPPPLLEREASGDASIAITGAGLYPTGIYLRHALSPRDGITVDAELSVQATRSGVQSLWVALTSTPDSSMLAAWDHATGFPQPHGQPIAQCTVGVPRGRLAPPWDSLFLAAGTTATVPVDAGLRHGARHRFRLQLFPDGWCGIAVDDRPVFASPSWLTSTPAAPFRLFVYGTSDGPPVRVHRVQVWTGVRDDIDWATVRQPTNAPSRRG